ncbi:hypothetical protein K8R14_01695 [bacterium]|nr:hypothetical protein [bacterium]
MSINYYNKLLQAAIRNRITIAFFGILFLMVCIGLYFGLIIPYLSIYTTHPAIKLIGPTIIFIFSIAVILWVVFSSYLQVKILNLGILKKEDMPMESVEEIAEASLFGNRNLKIAVACFGTFVGITILFSVIAIIFGFEMYFDKLFNPIVICVWVLICFIFFWKFYSKRLN